MTVWPIALERVPGRASFEGIDDLIDLVVGRHDQHARLRNPPPDLSRGQNTVHARQRNIHQHDVWSGGVHELEAAAGGVRFSGDFETWDDSQREARAHPKQGVVVDQDDFHRPDEDPAETSFRSMSGYNRSRALPARANAASARSCWVLGCPV
jgi:hypothetical protein